jgi:hypothetical protein
MRLLHPSQSPLESWVRTATWYQLASRFLAVAGTEAQAAMAESMSGLHDALAAEAVELSTAYGAGTKASHKRVAYLVGMAWSEVELMAAEAAPGTIPGSMGKLGQAVAVVSKFDKALAWIKKVGPWLLGLWVLYKVGPVRIYEGIERLFETDEQKEKRRAAAAAAWPLAEAAATQQCVTVCPAGDAACVATCKSNMKKSFAAAAPTGDTCDLLDTPTGTSLGGIFGGLAGLIVTETMLGWVP